MPQIQLDHLDRAILSQLIENGRRSFTDLATDLNVSAGTVRNRIARLEENGTVRVIGFMDLDQVGIHAYATVYVRVTPSRLIDQVVRQLEECPEVSFIASVAGEYDLHVDIQCLDNEHLTAFLRKRLHFMEGVVDTRTTMVLQIHKYGQPDLDALRVSAETLAESAPSNGKEGGHPMTG